MFGPHKVSCGLQCTNCKNYLVLATKSVKYISTIPERQFYRAFLRFGQAKFLEGGSVLDSCQFSILPHLPLKTMRGLKVVKIDSK